MKATIDDRGPSWRRSAMMALALAGLALSACQSGPTGELNKIDAAQGSTENISSLSSVIARNPRDPEAYNVRGSAYGRAGKYSAALNDFDKAIELNPNFYQAYANRALIQRFLGDQAKALADYNSSTPTMTRPISDAAISTARLAGRRTRSTISRRPSSWIRPIRAPTTIGG
jgi:tetratricopeptide (TPR) repeat protein